MLRLTPIVRVRAFAYAFATILSLLSLVSLDDRTSGVHAQSATGQRPESTGAPQTPPQDSIVRITTQLVQVDVVVTNDKGEHVSNLAAEDFKLEVDGKQYPITYFKSVSRPPGAPNREAIARNSALGPLPPVARPLLPEDVKRTIALVIDDDSLSFEAFSRVRSSLQKFVNEQMEEGDLVAVIRTYSNFRNFGRFTSDRKQLAATIERLRWRPGRGSSLQILGDSDQGAMTQGLDEGITTGRTSTLIQVARELSRLPGRKSAMLFSEGFRIASQLGSSSAIDRFRRVIDEAHRGGVTFYTIDAKGLEVDLPGGAGPITFNPSGTVRAPRNDAHRQISDRRFGQREGMIFLARETGGLAFFNANEMPSLISKSLNDNRSYYLVGFDPDDQIFDGKFRLLKVNVARKGLNIRTRSGFIGNANAVVAPGPKTRNEEITDALFSPFANRDIPVSLTPLFFTSAEGQTLVRTLVHFDCSTLALKDVEAGKKATSLELVALAFDEFGNVIDQAERHFTVTLDANGLARAMADGLVYQADFAIKKPGGYQFRCVLRETATGKMGTAGQFIQLPDLTKGRLAMSGLFLEGAAGNTRESSAVREFARNGEISYGALVYSATHNPTKAGATGGYQLTSQVQIIKDGKVVHETPARPIESNANTPNAEISVGGRLQLSGLEPGDYHLHIIVTDTLAPGKPARTSQWMDFLIRP